jgi:hypothetical protein
MFSYDWVGRDSQIRVSVTHEWSASWRADHGKHDVELGRRASKLAQAVLGSPGPQGAATNVPPLCGRTDRAWRIPPTSPPHKSEAGKKSTGRRLIRRYRPSGTPSSASSFEQLLSNVRTVECGSARKSSVGKSAKVVLGRAVKRPSSRGRRRQRIKLKRPGIVCRGRQAALETGKAPRVRNRDR